MKMKKNTTLKLSDIFVLFFCLGGSILSLWLFWNDLNATLSKLTEQPVASITFKYKISQRKLIDRLIWDRLRQDSPLYNGDTVRTADMAEATIHFSDNNKLELGANSIIQIFVDKTGTTSVDFTGGTMYADSLSSSNSMVVRSAGASVTLEPGAALAAAKRQSGQDDAQTGAKLDLQLISGNATYTTQNGTGQTLSGGISLDSAGGAQKQLLTVTSPQPSTRFLKQQGTTLNIPFSWETGQLPQGAQVILETASDRNFERLEEQIALTGIQSVSLDMAAGFHYWRFYVNAGGKLEDSVVSGKIQIIDAQPPNLIVPAQNDSFTYRTRLPQIRFMWSGNEYATSYTFEVANNARFENPVISQVTTQTSSIVSPPAAGRWYWRVTPSYAASASNPVSSTTAFFNVTQSGNLTSPLLVTPAQNSFINTAPVSAEQKTQTVFSWKHEAEAVFYTVRFAKNELFTDGLIERKTTDNWYKVIPETDGITNGRWYWAASCTDSEGNVSPFSSPRSFTAINGEMIFHTIFPPDGYSIADSRVRDTRFTWKKNFEDPVKLQIASTADFNRPVYDELLSATAVSTDGRQLGTGQWYWRLVSLTPEGKIAYETNPKSFTVVPPLDAPLISSPDKGVRIAVKPDQVFNALWQPVKGADYYQVSLYKGTDDRPLYQERLYGLTQAGIPATLLSNGNYRLTVQAFADETTVSSRRTGLTSEQTFSLKKIFPATLLSPADGTIYEGLDAMFSPADFRWASAEIPTEAEFILTRSKNALPNKHGETKAGATVISRQINPPLTAVLPPLKSGTYWWTITAKTADGFDISAEQPRMFTVRAIPPLSAVTSLNPADGTVFDATYLSKTREVSLSWQPVTGANVFELKLYQINKNSRQNRTLIKTLLIPAETASYTISDVGELDEGDFVWTVEALRRTQTGDILQQGTLTEAFFSIRLPPLPGIKLEKQGELYGS